MKLKQHLLKTLPYILITFIVGGLAGLRIAGAQIEDVSNFTGIHIKSSKLGTATPQLMIWNQGPGNAIEVRSTAGTVVYSVDKSGNSTQAGTETDSGLKTFTGGVSIAPNVVIVAPTAIATATPVFYVNSTGAHDLVVVSKAGTPVFTIGNAGAVTGNVVTYGAGGIRETCGSQAVTGSATVVHGLSTPVVVNANLAADPVGDQIVSYTNAAAVVTLKVWKNVAGTPSASADAVSVAWCIKGTP